MVRILFIDSDSNQLEIRTDGIDLQKQFVVTETIKGDVNKFQSLGITLAPGVSYNMGTLIEMAKENACTLISYPEGYGEQVYNWYNPGGVSYLYTLTTTTDKVNFVSGGGTEIVQLTSTKQKLINGTPEGDAENVPVKVLTRGAGFSCVQEADFEVRLVAERNPYSFIKEGSFSFIQQEKGGRSLVIRAEQLSALF